MIIGITGGTGSGKTTLLKLLEARGSKILDCDAIYHHLLRTDAALLAAIEDRFPGTVTAGVLDRKKLGNLVFADADALKELNRITHRIVRMEVLRQLGAQPKLAAIDAIGLFEGDLAELCDVTVAVLAPTEQRIQRLMARDGISEDYARSRIAAQHSDDWFRQRCDYVLNNDGDYASFETICLAFLDNLGIIEEKP